MALPRLKEGTRPPWVGLGAAIWLQVASGNAYTFPLYSHSMKSILGIKQQGLTMLGVFNDIGENSGMIAGVLCNKAPPFILLTIGAVTCFLGYGILWLALTQAFYVPYSVLCFALVIATNSSTWLTTAVIVTNMPNFPRTRGTVAGILKGFSGLSAAVFTELYSAVLHKSSSNLLLFLAVGIPLLCMILARFVWSCTPSSGTDSAEHRYFVFIQVASITLGVYLLTTTVLNSVLFLSAPLSYTFVAIMVLLLMAPLAIPLKMTLCPTDQRNSSNPGQSNSSADQLSSGEGNEEPFLNTSSSITRHVSSREGSDVSDIDNILAEGLGAVRQKRRPRRGEEFTFCEAILKADFWLLFSVYFLGVGSGVTVVNNLAQIGIAQGTSHTTILLSIFSFCNFIGRLGGGFVSEYYVRSIPRTAWMTVTQFIMVIVYIMFAFAWDGTLYAATFLLGICYGVHFTVMIPTSSELFGWKHFSIIYNFISIGNPIGALVFSSGLAGYVYDKEVAKQQESNLVTSSVACLGPSCFRLTFLVLSAVCCVGTALSVILTMRIRPVYRMLYSRSSQLIQPEDQ